MAQYSSNDWDLGECGLITNIADFAILTAGVRQAKNNKHS